MITKTFAPRNGVKPFAIMVGTGASRDVCDGSGGVLAVV